MGLMWVCLYTAYKYCSRVRVHKHLSTYFSSLSSFGDSSLSLTSGDFFMVGLNTPSWSNLSILDLENNATIIPTTGVSKRDSVNVFLKLFPLYDAIHPATKEKENQMNNSSIKPKDIYLDKVEMNNLLQQFITSITSITRISKMGNHSMNNITQGQTIFTLDSLQMLVVLISGTEIQKYRFLNHKIM